MTRSSPPPPPRLTTASSLLIFSAILFIAWISTDVTPSPTAAPSITSRLNRLLLHHHIKDEVRDEDTPQYIHPDEHTLLATVGRYPFYPGPLASTGQVKVTFHSTSLTLEATLAGLEPTVTAGVHIHAGHSCCSDASAGKDHLYNHRTHLVDPWNSDNDPNRATYTSLDDGTTDPTTSRGGSFHLSSGFGYDENIGRVVVVHDSNGVRVGCGVLVDPGSIGEGVESCGEEGQE